MNVEQLTKLFQRLGARAPEAWARSQVEEGIPQLARFLFLRQAWRLVVAESDTSWIATSQSEASAKPHDPGAAIGPSLERVLATGARPEDLATIVRVMQWRLLFGLCCRLDDPGDVEEEVSDVAWRLFQVDVDGRPLAEIAGLHESVLETDPTGREMRPR